MKFYVHSGRCKVRVWSSVTSLNHLRLILPSATPSEDTPVSAAVVMATVEQQRNVHPHPPRPPSAPALPAVLMLSKWIWSYTPCLSQYCFICWPLEDVIAYYGFVIVPHNKFTPRTIHSTQCTCVWSNASCHRNSQKQWTAGISLMKSAPPLSIFLSSHPRTQCPLALPLLTVELIGTWLWTFPPGLF